MKMFLSGHSRGFKSKFSKYRRLRYDSLQDIDDGIRLIELVPGDFKEDIKCLLHTTRLSANPEYEALSYVWGDPKVTELVICNGRRLEITVNLADALRHLRSKTEARILFADAICINQKDIKERGHQVRLMADVFHGAKHVVIWLGPDTYGTAELACGYIRGYSNYLVENYRKDGSCDDIMTWAGLSPDSIAFAALTRMLDVPWFMRVWTIQEAALAKSSTIAYGSSKVGIEELVRYLLGTREWSDYEIMLELDPCNATNLFRNVWNTYAIQGTWRDRICPEDILHQSTDSHTSVSSLMDLLAWRHVTDPRDLVYAMLGHPTLQAKDTTVPLVQADYGITYQELCHKLTIACIETNLDFSVLALVQHDEQTISRGVSTWVPDLNLTMMPLDGPVITTFTAGNQLIPQTSFQALQFCCRGIPIDVAQPVVQQFPQAVVQTFGSNAEDFIRKHFSTFQVMSDLMHLEFKMFSPVSGFLPSKIEFLAYVLSGCFSGMYGLSHSDQFLKPLEGYTIVLRKFLQNPLGRLSDEGIVQQRSRQGAGNVLDDITSTEMGMISWLIHFCQRRRPFLTNGGYLGLGPPTMKEGDVCCIINGACVPYILHPRGDSEGSYELVGECCLPGFMFGEVVEMLERGEVHEEMFTIY
jgi:hypothetical protein